MKVEINRSNEDTKEIEYPVLFEHRVRGFIVMFIAPRVGCVMLGDDVLAEWEQGDYCADWVAHTNTNAWKKFEGTLTISND